MYLKMKRLQFLVIPKMMIVRIKDAYKKIGEIINVGETKTGINNEFSLIP